MAHTVRVFKQTMPPQGELDCSELELRRVLDYMLNQSEIQLQDGCNP